MFPVTYHCIHFYEPIKMFLPFTLRCWAVHNTTYRTSDDIKNYFSPAELVLAFPPKIILFDIFVNLHFLFGYLNQLFRQMYLLIPSYQVQCRYSSCVTVYEYLDAEVNYWLFAELKLFSFDLRACHRLVFYFYFSTNRYLLSSTPHFVISILNSQWYCIK